MPNEINKALSALMSVTEIQIIEAVAVPPDEWGFTIDERIALVQYLLDRRSTLIGTMTTTMQGDSLNGK